MDRKESGLGSELSSEAAVIAMMLTDNATVDKIRSKIDPEMFINKANRLIYETALAVFDSSKHLDVVLVKEALGERLLSVGGVGYLSSILEFAPQTVDYEPYCQSIVDLHDRGGVRQKLDDAMKSLDDGEPVSTVLHRIAGLQKKPTTVEGGMDHLLESSVGLVENRRQHVGSLSFGFKLLDSSVGGIRGGCVYVIGGKTSQGKTNFALNTVMNNLKKVPTSRVLFNAFEDTDQIITRLTALEHGVSLSWFLSPEKLPPSDYELLKDKVRDLAKYRDRLRVLDGADIRRMRETCDEFKPDIVVVDFLQRYALRYGLANEGRLGYEIGKLMSDLKDLSTDKKCAVLALSQLSRRPEESRMRRPQINDFKESGEIENLADAALLLWWPHHENRQKDINEYIVCLDKNKMGPCMETRLYLDPTTLRLMEGRP